MTEFRTRLRNVRFKDGGAELRVLHTDMPNRIEDTDENWRGKMIEHAKYIADSGDGAVLDGFVVIGLWSDGKRSLGCRNSPRIPRELFPSYIAEILRTDLITENEAEQTFDRRFEWVGS